MAKIAGYSWGFNAYGNCGIGNPPVSTDSDSDEDYNVGQGKTILLPTPLYLHDNGEGEEEEEEEEEDNDRKLPAASPTKKITKDQLWELWAARGKGGGFVANGTYMVYGEQEKGEKEQRPKPTSHKQLRDVAGSPFHTLFVDVSGNCFACGWNRHCQLGVEKAHVQQYNYPAPVVFPTGKVRVSKVSAGAYHSACLSDKGKVYTWGDGSKGQLGYTELDLAGDRVSNRRDEKRRSTSKSFTVAGGGKSFRNAVPRIVEELDNVSTLSCGFYFTVAVTSKGRVYAFGDNSDGQLGLGKSCNTTAIPTRVNVGEGEIVKAVACGDNHTLMLTDEGTVWAAGLSTHGRLGCFLGNSRDDQGVREPIFIARFDELGVHVIKISAGGASSAAVSSNNDIYLWGYNEAGNLGLGHETNVFLPEKLRLLKGSDVALSEEHTALICEQGTIWTFGKNSCGRLGVVDAACDDAENFIDDAVVMSEHDEMEGEEGEKATSASAASNSMATATALAYPILPVSDINNNEVDNFNEVIREMVAEAAILPSPTCIGKILDENETGASGLSGLCCGGAHTISYVKAYSKQEGLPLLHECSNRKFGCRAAMLLNRIEHHEKICMFKRLSCPNMCRGCDRDDLEVSNFDRHVATCRFRLVDCKCGQQIILNEFKSHLDNICLAVAMACELCGEDTTRGELERHLEVCPEIKIQCGNCKIMISHKDFASHPERCMRRIITCACGKKLPADMIRNHVCKVVEKEAEEKEEAEELKSPQKLTRKSSTAKRVGGGFSIQRG